MGMTTSCAIKPIVPPKQKAVTVNGVEITRAEISQETQNHPASKPIEAWMSAARALTIRQLLLQEAQRLSLAPEPISDSEGRRETPEEALVRAVIDREVQTPHPDDASCHRYYMQNARLFRSADIFEVAHILIAARPNDQELRTAARAEAETIIDVLRTRPEQFADLARHHSACPSREVNGNLGQIGPGQTVPEFENALKTMTAGVVHHAPVESRYGFHVVKVLRHELGRPLPFELVRHQIADYLGESVRRSAICQYISLLAGRAVISGVDLAGSKTPLVQ